MVFHVSDLVQLAALDHRVIEHVDHGLAQRLGPVDPDQHRAGHVQAPLPQAHQQVGDQGRVLRRALHQRQRMLVALDADAQRHDAARLGEVHAVDHQRDQIQPGQIRDSSSASAVSVIATNRRETADLLVAEDVSATCSPTGSSPTG